MRRQINIVHPKDKQGMENFTNLLYTDIDSVPNYSVDFIFCACLNRIGSNNKAPDLLSTILKKIRLGGQGVLIIYNVKQACKLYLDSVLDSQTFFNVIKDCSGELVIETLVEVLTKQEYHITSIKTQTIETAIHFERRVCSINTPTA